MKSIPWVVVVAAAVASCVAPEQPYESTPSGEPEVVILHDEPEAVAASIAARLAESGYEVQERSATAVSASRTLESEEAAAMRMRIGIASSKTPEAELRFALVDRGDTVHVVGHPSVSTRVGMDQKRRHDMSANGAWWNVTQRLLEDVKVELEPKQEGSSVESGG